MTDEIETAFSAASATPAGAQAAWWLTMVHRRGEGASLADYRRYAPELADRFRLPASDTEVQEAWVGTAGRIGELVSVAFDSKSAFALEAVLTAAKDRRWQLDLTVEETPPHRITRLEWRRLYDFQLEVREAGEADAAVLSDLESRCPIEVGETSMWFDRGEAYFDFSRLIDDATVGLAFVDGAPAAVTCGARHAVTIGGEAKTIITVSHLRVLPEHQRKGLWGAANRVLDKYWPTVDGSNAFIAVDNAGMQHGFRHTPDKWPTTVVWARLDTARLAGEPFGRPSAPADAPAIADLLNAFHGGEEMFTPYTAALLTARLERAPDLYGWERLWLAEGAVVGVWPAGRALRLVTERGGERSFSEPGVVLDFAYRPGCEVAFEGLIRAWCAWLEGRGMNRLIILTSATSTGVDFIRSLADETEDFNHWTPGVPPPPDAAERGLYIDPIYF